MATFYYVVLRQCAKIELENDHCCYTTIPKILILNHIQGLPNEISEVAVAGARGS